MTSFKLSPGMTTVHQARQCQQELRDIIDAGMTLQQAHVSADLAEELQFNDAFLKTHSLEVASEQFEKLIVSAQSFEIIVAVEPSAIFLQDLIVWFRANLSAQALLTYKVRRSIGGGLIVRTRNRIYDFSFRPKVVAGKQHLVEVLRRV